MQAIGERYAAVVAAREAEQLSEIHRENTPEEVLVFSVAEMCRDILREAEVYDEEATPAEVAAQNEAALANIRRIVRESMGWT